jgi:hypothetical protein
LTSQQQLLIRFYHVIRWPAAFSTASHWVLPLFLLTSGWTTIGWRMKSAGNPPKPLGSLPPKSQMQGFPDNFPATLGMKGQLIYANPCEMLWSKLKNSEAIILALIGMNVWTSPCWVYLKFDCPIQKS